MVDVVSSMGVKDHFQVVKLTLKEPALIPIVDTERGGVNQCRPIYNFNLTFKTKLV